MAHATYTAGGGPAAKNGFAATAGPSPRVAARGGGRSQAPAPAREGGHPDARGGPSVREDQPAEAQPLTDDVPGARDRAREEGESDARLELARNGGSRYEHRRKGEHPAEHEHHQNE